MREVVFVPGHFFIYSIFTGLGTWVTSCNEMLTLRFLVGLGVGGMWPNGVALVAESWPDAARPTVAGVLGAGINVGVLGLSQIGRYSPITPDSCRQPQPAAVPTTCQTDFNLLVRSGASSEQHLDGPP